MPLRLCVAFLAAMTGVLCEATALTQSHQAHTVLIILPGSDEPGYGITNAAVRESLQSQPDILIDYFREYLEVEHLSDDDAAQGLRESIRRKFKARPPDVVIAYTTPAREFVLRFRQELFPHAAVVFMGLGGVEPSLHQEGVTGIDTAPGIEKTLALALALHPSTREVVVLVRALDGRYLTMVRPFLDPFAARVRLTFITDRPLQQLLTDLAALPADALVFYIQYSADEPGTPLSQTRIAELIGHASSVPVYGVVEAQVGTGAVGGLVRSDRELGLQLGTLARRIVSGEPASGIPVQPANLLPVFDWRQLERWGIPPASLPPRSEVRFREQTAWERYQWQIVGTLVVLAIQSTTIIGLIVQRARRRDAQRALLESQAQLAQASRLSALGEFAASIAHEVRQPLTAILTSTRAALRFLGNGAPDEARDALFYVLDAGKRADEVIERNRELFRTNTVHKERLDFNAVVTDAVLMTRDALEAQRVTLTTDVDAALPPLLVDRLQIQQVLVNLLLNAVDAVETTPPDSRRIMVSTRLIADVVQTDVRDNGLGLSGVDTTRMFELSYTTKPTGTGVGLSISRSIVEAHGGRIWAAPNPDRGAIFSFTLPVSL